MKMQKFQFVNCGLVHWEFADTVTIVKLQELLQNDPCFMLIIKPEIPEMIENESEELLLSQNLLAVQ